MKGEPSSWCNMGSPGSGRPALPKGAMVKGDPGQCNNEPEIPGQGGPRPLRGCKRFAGSVCRKKHHPKRSTQYCQSEELETLPSFINCFSSSAGRRKRNPDCGTIFIIGGYECQGYCKICCDPSRCFKLI